MQSLKIFPVPKVGYYIEVVICDNTSQFGEFVPDAVLDEDDHSVFILNDSEFGSEYNCIGTILFLEDALELGTIVHQATRAGMAFGKLMLGLAGASEDEDDDLAFVEEQTANVAQEIFNQIHSYATENFAGVV
jgi:hypothetical protein